MRRLAVAVVALMAFVLGAAAPTAAQCYSGYYDGYYQACNWGGGWTYSYYPEPARAGVYYNPQPYYAPPTYSYEPTYYAPSSRSRCSMADRLQLYLDNIDTDRQSIICR
jgi:hypothetical protein